MFRRSHISVVIWSRTWRALSRAWDSEVEHRAGSSAVEGQGVHRVHGMAHGRVGATSCSPTAASAMRAAWRGRIGLVQHGVQHHLRQAADVLGPLDIAADPVEAVGDAGEHHAAHRRQPAPRCPSSRRPGWSSPPGCRASAPRGSARRA